MHNQDFDGTELCKIRIFLRKNHVTCDSKTCLVIRENSRGSCKEVLLRQEYDSLDSTIRVEGLSQDLP